MTEDPLKGNPGAGQSEAAPTQRSGQPRSPLNELLPLPGLAAISLYLLVLAGVIILGVTGRHYPQVFLIFAAGFMAASAGLLMLFRWAWALALAAVLLLVVYNLWIFASQHQGAALVQGLLNLVFFLYLVRPEVRERLR
jgi:hypothetical protein